MGVGTARAFEQNRDTWGVASQANLAPDANLPVGTARHIEQSEIASAQLRGVQGISMHESPVSEGFNRGVDAIGGFIAGMLEAPADKSPSVEAPRIQHVPGPSSYSL